MWRSYRAFELALKSSFQNLHHKDFSCCQICICPFSTVLNGLFFGPFLGTPGPSLGTPRFSKLVQNLRLGPPTARSTFVPRCSNRLGPPEPSDRHFGRFGLFLGRFWALEVPNLTNFVSGKWNEARGTLRVEKNVPVDPNGKKNFGPPPLTHCAIY